MTIRFHYSPPTCSLAAMVALEIVGLLYEPVSVDLAGDRHLLNAQNPLSKVPVLEIDGFAVSDTIAIISYLNTRHPDAGLLPVDPRKAATTLSRMAWLGSELHIRRRRFAMPMLFTPDLEAQTAISSAARPVYVQGLQVIDSWFANDQPPPSPGLEAYALLFYHWATRDKLTPSSHSNLGTLATRMAEISGIRRALELHASPLLAEAL